MSEKKIYHMFGTAEGSEMEEGHDHYDVDEPFTFLSGLIASSIKKNKIPTLVSRLRNGSIFMTSIALGVYIFELYRFAAKSGPHTGGNHYAFIGIWSVVSVLGSLIATIGSLALRKGMILAGALIFCCAVAPATPNMIVLSAGEEYQYWICLTVFVMLTGFLLAFLFIYLV